MSIVIGMKANGRVLMAADRRLTYQTTLYAPGTKLHRIGLWVLGITGALADSYLFRRDLPPNVDFSDPTWYAERIKLVTDHGKALTEVSGNPNGISFQMLAARHDELFMCNQDGVVWPVEYEAIGAGNAIGMAFLHQRWNPMLSLLDARQLATDIYDYTRGAELSVGDGLDLIET